MPSVKGSILSRELRSRRSDLKLTQQDVAKRSGLIQTNYSKIEQGKTDPRFSTLQDIARALALELMLVPTELVDTVNALAYQGQSPDEKPLFSAERIDAARPRHHSRRAARRCNHQSHQRPQIFVFDPAYVADPNRPILSLGFLNAKGELASPTRPPQVRLLPFLREPPARGAPSLLHRAARTCQPRARLPIAVAAGRRSSRRGHRASSEPHLGTSTRQRRHHFTGSRTRSRRSKILARRRAVEV